MKTNTKVSSRGFTLIEMVGVLAVIAILAALLVPKIFSAINDSRFSSTVESLNNVKTACMDYFGKQGSFPTAPHYNFETNLITAGNLERPLACKIATSNSLMQVVTDANSAGGVGYFLDGVTATTNCNQVIECVLKGVARGDAWELSKRMDGDTLSATDATTGDSKGRVVYKNQDPTDVYVYVAHK